MKEKRNQMELLFECSCGEEFKTHSEEIKHIMDNRDHVIIRVDKTEEEFWGIEEDNYV